MWQVIGHLPNFFLVDLTWCQWTQVCRLSLLNFQAPVFGKDEKLLHNKIPHLSPFSGLALSLFSGCSWIFFKEPDTCFSCISVCACGNTNMSGNFAHVDTYIRTSTHTRRMGLKDHNRNHSYLNAVVTQMVFCTLQRVASLLGVEVHTV